MTKSEHLKKTKAPKQGAFMVGRLGFEPGMTEPKPVVLPLHHRPIAAAKVHKKTDAAKFCS